MKPNNQNHSTLFHPSYRSDIDGLRGLAVLAVVFFHAFPNWVNAGYLGKGGFTGVDIFFVISGFLISSILFKSLADGSFSFIKFYEKRINRIFPALIIVLIFSLIFGWFILLPHEFFQLGKHVIGAVTYTNNIMYWKESGYFDNESITKPLLHLWSLSIEEQFYIFWPLLLWVCYKKKLNLLTITVLVFFFSFYSHIHKIQLNKVAAFYAAHLRMWELLVGSLVAYINISKNNWRLRFFDKVDNLLAALIFSHKIQSNGEVLKNFQSVVGAVLIVFGIIFIDKTKLFPGWWALFLPVLGTALVIGAGSIAWVNRKILSNKVLVAFGLISYPLYLWHWPLLSFAEIVESGSPSRNLRISIIIVSIALSFLTYIFVEKPIRFGRFQRQKNIVMVCAMLIIGVSGFAAYKNHLTPKSNTLEITKYISFSGYEKPADEYINDQYKFGQLGTNQSKKIALIGDSHAEQYRNTFANIYKNHDQEKKYPSVIYNFEYVDTNGLVVLSNNLLKDETVSAVVFSKFWALNYVSDKINYAVRCCGSGQGGSVGGNAYHEPLSEEQMDAIDRQLEGAAISLIKAGKKVYFVLDNPFGEEFSPKGLVKRSLSHGFEITHSGLSKDLVLERSQPSRDRIIRVAKKTGAQLIDPIDYLCGESYCSALTNNEAPIYKDYDHLSLYAVKNLVHYLDFIVTK